MKIAPLGISYGYYTNPYASGATRSAARTAVADMLHGSNASVQPVDDVPEVFSNDEVDRVERSPERLQQDRRDAYEIMNSLNPRNAEHLNAPLEFQTKKPFAQEEAMTGSEKPKGPEECETCKERKYVDGSNEGDVSFKTPGHISPEASAAKVMAHEQEHVQNAIQEGNEEGKELVSASVTLKTAVCPECGTTYVSGGETRTTIRHGAEENPYAKQQQAFEDFANGRVSAFNQAA